jgi:hypothetical protein
MDAAASLPFETFNETGETGLVGTITVKVEDNDGGITLGPTTANITELGSSGVYVWNAPAAPASLGSYTIMWSTDGTFDPDTVSTEELVVFSPSAVPTSPLPPPDDSADSTQGPCSAWLTGEDVAECCSAAAEDVGTFYTLLDDAADVASQLLYELSGRRFAGLCSKDGVRPCHGDCSCGIQVLSRGHLVVDPYLYSSTACSGRNCGCNDMSRVPLAGYVRQVTQVKIDGVVLDSSAYTVVDHRWLTRIDGSRWPSCSHVELPDTEEGTFSVNYTFGKQPPWMAIEAAKQLACQVYLSCSGGGDGADCQIPVGATRITRQGITVERAIFARNPETGAWETGMASVDRFLNAANPAGIQRRAIGFGSRRARYPRTVG